MTEENFLIDVEALVQNAEDKIAVLYDLDECEVLGTDLNTLKIVEIPLTVADDFKATQEDWINDHWSELRLQSIFGVDEIMEAVEKVLIETDGWDLNSPLFIAGNVIKELTKIDSYDPHGGEKHRDYEEN